MKHHPKCRRVMLRLWAFAIMFLCCGALPAAQPLTVAVAANMKVAFGEIATEFQKQTGIAVQGVFGASGKIVAQVRGGAPYDVFLSADTAFPEALYRDGVATAMPRVYAKGVLVLWTLKKIPLYKGMVVVSDPAVTKVAIADPKLAPYGRAANQALERAGFAKAAAPKLVFGESIGQTLQFAYSGAADVAFVAKSQVIAAEMADKGRWVEVPKEDYEAISQSLVVLKHDTESHAEEAQRFVEFMFSPKVRAILIKYGYLLP